MSLKNGFLGTPAILERFFRSSEDWRIGKLYFFSMIVLLMSPVDAWAALAKPEWTSKLQLESSNGDANLGWTTGKGTIPDIFRLTEKMNGESRLSYVTGDQLHLHRSTPGLYRFSLEGCLRGQSELPICGSKSKELRLTVTEAIYQPYIQARPAKLIEAPASNMAVGGPSQLRPGKWFNPNKSGIGWSMYWSNRLALSQNPTNVYDLQVIWYTYEAKRLIAYCDGPNDTCPPLVKEYLDYRPVVASMNLVKHQNNNSFVGSITIRRNGTDRNVGSATLNFGATNTEASIQWSADFKKQTLSGADNIMLLAGGDGSSAHDASGSAGLWGNSNGSSFISADIGSISQTLEAVFYDDNGDPTWIMAHKYEPNLPPVAGSTDLCFYYTPGGYPPNQDQPGLLSSLHTSCDPDNATSLNRNGLRYFSAAETGRFWINFSLPPGQMHDNSVAGGSLRLGSSTTPAELTKAANLHRIWHSGSDACQINSTTPSCAVSLTWFTDSDFPNASVWAYNQTTGQRNLIEVSTAAAMENRQANLAVAGTYVFELYQGNNTASTLLGTSSAFTVSQATNAPLQPTGLMASWTNEAIRAYQLNWDHANTGSVSYYQLLETTPSGSSSAYTVSPGSTRTKSFARSSGPWGNYTYRVKACNSSNQCSADIAATQWLVTDPNTPPAGIPIQPWKTNQYGNLLSNLGYQYALGYHFVPAVNGQVTQLGGYFNGTKQVKLFHRSSGELLATATVSSSNSWNFVNITPVSLTAGEQYTVAGYLAGSGATARSGVSFPKTYGDITILASAYASTSSNPNAIPNLEESLVAMYGQVDIGFVPGITTALQAPTISSVPAQQHEAGSTVSLQVSASDPDGNVVAFAASGLPAGLVVNNAGLISGTVASDAASASPYAVTITVTDNDGLTAQANFDWIITASNPSGTALVFSDSFEVGEWNNLWSEDSQNDWFRSSQRASEGNRSAEVDGTASDAQLISIPVDLQGSNSARIEFDWYIESGLDTGEYLAFDVSSNGGTSWTEKNRLRGNVDQENVWHHEVIELAGLNSLRLRFRGSMSLSSEDANVDNVNVFAEPTAANAAPVVSHPGNQYSTTGQAITPLHVIVTDADYDSMTCIFTGLPSGLSESSDCIISGTLSATPNTYSVSVTANDGKVNSVPVSFDWIVTAASIAANPETPPAPAAVPSMAASASSSQVGATTGSFRVTEAGQASYSIPLMAAAGSGGMSPQMSLEYSSGGGNGPVGVGWSIGGQSMISRCAQTSEQDGSSAARGITLTSSDRFCLDGQRLMLFAGSYGAPGSEYRGEIDTITKVVANGSAGIGPASFTVWRKDGSVTEYGNSSDSRIEARAADNQTVLFWAMNRTSDSAGNYITYHYQEAGSKQGDPVEFILQKVAYTGNSRVGTAPFAELNFIYDAARLDVQNSYLAGAGLAQTQRLVRVDSKSRADASSALQSMRSYVLTYSHDAHDRSLLTSVKECRDSTQAYCFPPTVFDWQLRDDAINAATTGSLSLPSVLYGLTLGDVNGDARPDLLYTQKSGSQYQLKTALALASGGFSVSSVVSTLPTDGNGEPVNITTIDLNADGFQDVIYAFDSGSGAKWHARISGENSSTFSVLSTSSSATLSLLKVMDFDGDGLPDLLYGYKPGQGPGQQLVWQRNTFTPGGVAGFAPAQVITVELADLFPDNIPDSNPFIKDRWFINDEHPSFATEANPVRSEVFDYNGDGAVDLLVKVSRQYCQTGCGFEFNSAEHSASSESFLRLENLVTESFSPAESGQATALVEYPNTHTAIVSFWVIYESNGQDDFKPAIVIAKDMGCTLNEVCDNYADFPLVRDPRPADINADGLADLLYRDLDGTWQFRLNSGNGLTGELSINGQLTDGLHYAAQLHDVNGDGLPDLIYPSAAETASAKWAVHYNQSGLSFGAAQLTAAPAGNSLDKDSGVFVDFSGDGKLDHLFINRNSLSQVQNTELRLGGNKLATGSTVAVPASVLVGITDGFASNTTLTYRPLTDTTVYSRMQDAANANWGRGFAVYDLVAPVFVVSQVESSAPTYSSTSAQSRMEYHYVGAKLQAGGRGLLGFAEVISYDPQQGLRTNSRYRQDFPYIGMPADASLAKVNSSQKFHSISNTSTEVPVNWGAVGATTADVALPSGTRLSYSINQWAKHETAAGKGAWFPYIANSLERAYTLVGGFNRKVLTTNTFNNNYGNLDSMVVRTYAVDGFAAVATQTTNNAYSDNISSWHLGRLTSSTVTHARSGKSSITRNSSFFYDATTGILNRETIEAGSSQFEIVTNYGLDNFGNRTSSSVKPYGMPERISSLVYDSLGRYVIESRNAFSQVVSRVTQRDVFGNQLRVENIDGVVSLAGADFMGRMFVSWVETGAWQKTTMVRGAGSYCPSTKTAFHAMVVGGGQPTQYRCSDKLGREVRIASQSFGGGYIFMDTDYDENGHVARVSEPYFNNGPVFWNETAYDPLGRGSAVLAADGNHLTYDYDETASACSQPGAARQVKTSNGLGQEQLEIRNALGETTAIYDASCGLVAYDYDSVGNLTRLTGADGSVTLMTYDKVGRKISLDDDDKGYWQYAYNPLGEMTRQQDSKQQAIDFEFDALGRVTTRYERTGVSSLGDNSYTTVNSETTSYINSTSAAVMGKGQAASTTYRVGTNGVVVHQQNILYDEFGRASSISANQDGLTLSDETSYDQYGRVFQQFDTSGDFRGVRYHYNPRGYLEKLQEAREGAQGVFYQHVLGQDQRGNVSAAILGNGVEVYASYNAGSGRLQTLEAYDKNSIEIQNVSYSFDVLGNLQYRHDTSKTQNLKESFVYDSLNRLEQVLLSTNGATAQITLGIQYDKSGNITHKSDIGNYLYGQNGAGAHAVTTAGSTSYSYDANGNQVSASDGRNIIYTVFDQAGRIQKGGETTEFFYGIGSQRIKRVDNNAVDTSKTTWYFGSVERIQYAGENAFFRRAIGGIAIVDYFPSTDTASTSFLIKDHLGSIHTVTDQTGLVASSVTMHFGAFGERQNTSWNDALSLAGSQLQNMITTRGFTGHEQVDGLGIVHMNGRIYDPKLGRFLQADPFVQAPKNSQSLNRYSYVFNNPLSYTDPSGYFSIKSWIEKGMKFGGSWYVHSFLNRYPWLNSIVSGALNVIPGCQIWCSALFNASSSYVATGSLNAAFKAGAISYASGYVSQGIAGAELGQTQRIVATAATSRATAELQHRQLDVKKLTVVAIAGGYNSISRGSRFVNGAITASLSYAIAALTPRGRAPSEQEITYARLAFGVYDPTFVGVDGYQRVGDTLVDEVTGLQMALFVNKTTRNRVMAFAGTNDSNDWRANIAQGLGFRSAHYIQAMDLAGSVSARGPVHFVGHSLGGGLATAMSIRWNSTATVFNSSIVHFNTVGGLSSPAGSVTHFRSTFDVLRPINVMTPGAKFYEEQVQLGAAGLHGMNQVCKAMGC